MQACSPKGSQNRKTRKNNKSEFMQKLLKVIFGFLLISQYINSEFLRQEVIMLKRKASQKMQAWLDAPTQKALLITGARQVGKSFLAASFLHEHFDNVVIFDLLEDAQTRNSFAAATSADDLFLRMGIAAPVPIVDGKTAILIDEVQECPNVVTLVKYLVQKGNVRYVLTGSLLGVKLQNIDSLPVGYLTQLEMYPLDFEEFCWAAGLTPDAFSLAREALAMRKPLPDYLYDRLLALFHRFLLVGGMPDAVNTFIVSNNIDEVRTVQENLHALYRSDITKHAPKSLRLTIRDIYNLIPNEAASKNKRFRLGSIPDVRRYTQVSDQFLWLANAGVALPVYNTSAPTSPLLLSEKRSIFKLFYLDVGLLTGAYPKQASIGILDGCANMNMGGVYEAFVAQHLKASGFALRYFNSKKIGELDFLAEQQSGRIIAIEVKSGSEYLTHAALDNAMATKGYTIDEAVVLAETNLQCRDGITYAPIFLAGCIDYNA